MIVSRVRQHQHDVVGLLTRSGRGDGQLGPLDDRDETFDFKAHRQRMTSEGTAADIAAAITRVRSEAGGGAQRVFTVGFCMGGRISFNQAADRDDLDGVIGFYGTPHTGGPDDARAPITLAPGYRCPVLGLFGGADEGIPVEALDRFRETLNEAGVPNEIGECAFVAQRLRAGVPASDPSSVPSRRRRSRANPFHPALRVNSPSVIVNTRSTKSATSSSWVANRHAVPSSAD